MDGVHPLDKLRGVLDPVLQIVCKVVADVVDLPAVCRLSPHHIQLVLRPRLVHQVVREDGGVVPAQIPRLQSSVIYPVLNGAIHRTHHLKHIDMNSSHNLEQERDLGEQ
jgi:hypothetical protein